MTARRPADIAADLREAAQQSTYWPGGFSMAAELDRHAAEHVCVPKDRWPTADEIAELREAARWFRDGVPNMCEAAAARLIAFLDRLDPPQPEPTPATVMVELDYDLVRQWADILPPGTPAGDAARAALDAREQA